MFRMGIGEIRSGLALACLLPGLAVAFDHQHSQWSSLLAGHVAWVTPHNTRVDYRGFLFLETFTTWSDAQQLAFLINAYNAFTVKLILSEYPDLDSIKDTGGLFQSPWKIEFFQLLGEDRHLDWIERQLPHPKGRGL